MFNFKQTEELISLLQKDLRIRRLIGEIHNTRKGREVWEKRMRFLNNSLYKLSKEITSILNEQRNTRDVESLTMFYLGYDRF